MIVLPIFLEGILVGLGLSLIEADLSISSAIGVVFIFVAGVILREVLT